MAALLCNSAAMKAFVCLASVGGWIRHWGWDWWRLKKAEWALVCHVRSLSVSWCHCPPTTANSSISCQPSRKIYCTVSFVQVFDWYEHMLLLLLAFVQLAAHFSKV